LADLERALDRLHEDIWIEARHIARRLEAEPAFGAGLALLPAGEALAVRLGLTSKPSIEMWIKKQDDPTYWSALLIDSILNVGGIRAGAMEIARWAFPSAPAMRARRRLARRGKRGLAAAHATRWASFWVRGPAAVLRWIGARRSVRRDNSGSL
jgi:hypothetical protein